MRYTDPAHQDLHNRHRGYLELPLLKDLASLVSGPGLALDIGANVGNHAVYFAKEMNLDVMAYEPHPETFAVLQQNANDAGVSVTCINSAVGESSGVMYLTDKENSGQNSLAESLDSGHKIPVRVSDLAELGDLPVNLVKIDVEGWEKSVLTGQHLQFLIEKHRPVLSVETNALGDILDLLPRGYRVHAKHGGAPTYILVDGPSVI